MIHHDEIHQRFDFAGVAVTVNDIRLEQNCVTCIEQVPLPFDSDLDRTAGNDEVCQRARRIRIGLLDAPRRKPQFVELDLALAFERKRGT
jgi:hypothetical protein